MEHRDWVASESFVSFWSGSVCEHLLCSFSSMKEARTHCRSLWQILLCTPRVWVHTATHGTGNKSLLVLISDGNPFSLPVVAIKWSQNPSLDKWANSPDRLFLEKVSSKVQGLKQHKARSFHENDLIWMWYLVLSSRRGLWFIHDLHRKTGRFWNLGDRVTGPQSQPALLPLDVSGLLLLWEIIFILKPVYF